MTLFARFILRPTSSFFLFLLGAYCLLISFDLKANLRIATWNMEWLSDKGDMIQGRRFHEDYLMMQNIAGVLNADLIAFQEVDSLHVLKNVFSPEKYNFYLSERADILKYRKNSQQFTGWVVKKHFSVQDRPDNRSLALPSLFRQHHLRYGSYIELIRPDEPNLHLLSIHLKSGCFDKSPHSNSACRKLARQINALVVWIKTRILLNQAFIIAGDFNHYLDTESDWVWKRLIDEVGIKNLINLTANTDAKCKVRHYNFRTRRWENRIYHTLIDHIIASPNAISQLHLLTSKQFQYSYHTATKYRLPDHCPVYVDLAPLSS